MLHRALDVIFQYVIRLIAAIVVVPLAVGALGFAVDHSVVVEARVWADKPLFTPTFATDRFDSFNSPAEIEAGMVQELVNTSGFASEVLTQVDRDYPYWSADHQISAEGDLQHNLAVSADGTHPFTITYPTTNPNPGRTLLTPGVAAFRR